MHNDAWFRAFRDGLLGVTKFSCKCLYSQNKMNDIDCISAIPNTVYYSLLAQSERSSTLIKNNYITWATEHSDTWAEQLLILSTIRPVFTTRNYYMSVSQKNLSTTALRGSMPRVPLSCFLGLQILFYRLFCCLTEHTCKLLKPDRFTFCF